MNPPIPPPPAPAPLPVPNSGSRFVIDANIGFHERGRIPAIVSDLPEFSGNARNLSQWILDVEDILELFQDHRDTFHYHLILKTIRRKIKNEANDVLVTNNTPLEWNLIKEVLCLYYADKRDLMTLDHQLKSMMRGRVESIETYYSRVREMITLISSAIAMDDQWRGHEAAIIKLYNMISLDTFIRGLGEPLSLFCKNYRPASLAQAYHYCVEYLNIDARNVPFKGTQSAPTPAPRGNLPQQYPSHRKPNPIPNTRTYNPNPTTQHPHKPPPYPPRNSFSSNPNAFTPNRTFNPQTKQEPMEIDNSIRTRMVNYGNRPTAQRRQASESMRAHGPNVKRMANILEECPDPEEYEKWYAEQLELSKEFFNDNDYVESLENLNDENSNETTASEMSNQAEETNFLEDTDWVTKWFP